MSNQIDIPNSLISTIKNNFTSAPGFKCDEGGETPSPEHL